MTRTLQFAWTMYIVDPSLPKTKTMHSLQETKWFPLMWRKTTTWGKIMLAILCIKERRENSEKRDRHRLMRMQIY